MTAPDPRNPKVGDRFTADYRARGEVAEVRFVDVDGAVAYRYVEPTPSTGGGFMCSADEFAAHFQPAPEPLITEPLTIRETKPYRLPDDPGCWTSVNFHWSYLTGRSITILPDHTWREGT